MAPKNKKTPRAMITLIPREKPKASPVKAMCSHWYYELALGFAVLLANGRPIVRDVL